MNNLNVIVTGGAHGIGKAIALEFAKNGCSICFSYCSSKSDAEITVDEIKKYGVECYEFHADVTDQKDSEEFVKFAIEKMKKIDVLINNSGIRRDKSLALMKNDEWQDVINTNLTGVFNITKSVVYHMIKNKTGHIINISSASGIMGLPGQCNYSASKAGIIGFTKALAKETAKYNIMVNAVAPGFIISRMTESISEKGVESAKADIPVGRFGTVEEVAKVVAFLGLGGDSYITGQVIAIDGGLSI